MFAPVAIEDPIMGSLRERMNDRDYVAPVLPFLAAGGTLQVSEEPFEGWQGVLGRDLSDGLRRVIFPETRQHCRLVVDSDAVERTPNL
jgi:hypothetical protein